MNVNKEASGIKGASLTLLLTQRHRDCRQHHRDIYNSHYPYRVPHASSSLPANAYECVRFSCLNVDAFTFVVRSLKNTKATDLGYRGLKYKNTKSQPPAMLCTLQPEIFRKILRRMVPKSTRRSECGILLLHIFLCLCFLLE